MPYYTQVCERRYVDCFELCSSQPVSWQPWLSSCLRFAIKGAQVLSCTMLYSHQSIISCIRTSESTPAASYIAFTGEVINATVSYIHLCMDLDDGHYSYHCNLAPKVPACSATCNDIASCHFCQVYMPYNYNTILKIQGTGIYNLALVLPVIQGKKS